MLEFKAQVKEAVRWRVFWAYRQELHAVLSGISQMVEYTEELCRSNLLAA